LMQQKAASDLRATQVPADPSQYKIELPKDFALPAGLDFKFNEADPALAGARAWSHANHLTQDQFGDLLAQYASLEATKEAKFRTDMKAQLDALGVNGTMRVTALETWLRGTVGDDLAKAMKAGMFSAKIVQGLEIIAKKMATQGHGSFRQDGREPNTGGKGPLSSMPDAEYDALSANEKYKISRM
jgi:hypothetical protein